jgi:hypothetical protein
MLENQTGAWWNPSGSASSSYDLNGLLGNTKSCDVNQ